MKFPQPDCSCCKAEIWSKPCRNHPRLALLSERSAQLRVLALCTTLWTLVACQPIRTRYLCDVFFYVFVYFFSPILKQSLPVLFFACRHVGGRLVDSLWRWCDPGAVGQRAARRWTHGCGERPLVVRATAPPLFCPAMARCQRSLGRTRARTDYANVDNLHRWGDLGT